MDYGFCQVFTHVRLSKIVKKHVLLLEKISLTVIWTDQSPLEVIFCFLITLPLQVEHFLSL